MLQTQEYIAQVYQGKIPYRVSKSIQSAIACAEGKKIIISLKPFRKRRSNPQNAFYWGVVVPLIRRLFMDAGTACSEQEVHLYLKQHVGKLTKEIKLPDGNSCIVAAESHTLTTAEWENYLTAIRVWAAQFGCIVPMPNETGTGSSYADEHTQTYRNY